MEKDIFEFLYKHFIGQHTKYQIKVRVSDITDEMKFEGIKIDTILGTLAKYADLTEIDTTIPMNEVDLKRILLRNDQKDLICVISAGDDGSIIFQPRGKDDCIDFFAMKASGKRGIEWKRQYIKYANHALSFGSKEYVLSDTNNEYILNILKYLEAYKRMKIDDLLKEIYKDKAIRNKEAFEKAIGRINREAKKDLMVQNDDIISRKHSLIWHMISR